MAYSGGSACYIYLVRDVSFSDNYAEENDDASSVSFEHVDDLRFEKNTVKNNETRGVWISPVKNLEFLNNEIYGNNSGTSDGGGGYINFFSTGTSVISNNLIYNNLYRSGGGLYLAIGNSNQTIEITNNKVFGNDAANEGGGILTNCDRSSSYYQDITFVNNAVFENRAGVNGYGIWMDDVRSLSMSNNTVANNKVLPSGAGGSGGGLYLYIHYDTEYADIYNNIFWNNSATNCSDIYINDDGNNNYVYSPVRIYNNDFDQSEDGFCIPHFFPVDPSNLDKIDPLFADEENNDYQLGEFSPCIDAGTDWDGAPDTDIDGTSRPIGAAIDMGAYESIYSCDLDGIRRDGSYFSDLTSCMAGVAADATILCHAKPFHGDIDFDRGYVIDLEGGYNCDFTDNSIEGYFTGIEGVVTISDGSVIFSKIVIQ